jgi:hypothetical protein
MKNESETIAKINTVIAGTDKGKANVEHYPLASADEDKTVLNVNIKVFKPVGYSSHMASIIDENDQPSQTLVAIKGLLDEDNLPDVGKLKVLKTPGFDWQMPDGRKGTVKADTTKAYIVV